MEKRPSGCAVRHGGGGGDAASVLLLHPDAKQVKADFELDDCILSHRFPSPASPDGG